LAQMERWWSATKINANHSKRDMMDERGNR
jgi:hypothetical protein